MTFYLDTSAIVKLYVEEEGSSMLRGALGRAELIASSILAHVEARAALARRYREGWLTAPAYHRTVRTFEVDWGRYAHVPVTESLIRAAARLTERYALRAYDAVHLASAVNLRQGLVSSVTFCCWGLGLSAAARKTRFKVFP